MTEGRLGSDMLRSAIDLSVDYYSGLLRLSRDYWKSLGSLVTREAPVQRPASAPRSPSPPLMLIGKLGEEARASFLVENSLGDTVTARFAVRGEGPAAAVRVDPEERLLVRGEQCVVQARVLISKGMKVGQDYSGELAIPELASRSIPFVIRRVAAPRAGK